MIMTGGKVYDIWLVHYKDQNQCLPLDSSLNSPDSGCFLYQNSVLIPAHTSPHPHTSIYSQFQSTRITYGTLQYEFMKTFNN